jgi:signal transduction histidine kinase
MSAISSRAPERIEAAARWQPSALTRVRPGQLVDALLAAFMLVMLALMVLIPGEETIPYHFLFLALTIVYGFRVWSLVPTLVVTVLVTATTGWVLTTHAYSGYIDFAELAEVPLMPMLFVAMVWHAQRRVAAQRQVELMADQRRASLEREREFLRDASHAIRTPVTIARGHVELAAGTDLAEPVREDLEIVLRQLERMSSLSNRLMALARLDAGEAVRPARVDIAEFLEEVARNWSSGVNRDWLVDCRSTGVIQADPEWLELALDALIENAVHFTGPGERIRLACATGDEDLCTILVSDGGPGIESGDLPHLFERFWHRRPPDGPMGSGLGLPMALAAAQAHGGTLSAHNDPGGGAVFVLSLPRISGR